MNRKALIVGVAVLSLAFTGAAFAAGKTAGRTSGKAAAKGNGAEVLILKGGKLGNIEFPHQEHQTKLKDCEACHKLFPQEAGSIQQLISNGLLQKKQVMNNCISCHKDRDAQGKDAGPISSCKECHNK